MVIRDGINQKDGQTWIWICTKSPALDLFVDVILVSADPLQYFRAQLDFSSTRQPFRALGSAEQTDPKHNSNCPASAQNQPPHLVVAVEVTQQLRRKNAAVDHYLRKGSEKASLSGRSNLRHIYGDYHNRRPGANAGQKPPDGYDRYAGSERFEKGPKDEEYGRELHRVEPTTSAGDRCRDQCPNQASKCEYRAHKAQLREGHGYALWEGRRDGIGAEQ